MSTLENGPIKVSISEGKKKTQKRVMITCDILRRGKKMQLYAWITNTFGNCIRIWQMQSVIWHKISKNQ